MNKYVALVTILACFALVSTPVSAASPTYTYNLTVAVSTSDSQHTAATVSLNGNGQPTGAPGYLTFSRIQSGIYSLVTSAPGYQTNTTTVSVASYNTSISIVLKVASGSALPVTGGISPARLGSFSGASATFSNQGASRLVNVYFVWSNSANQVVSVDAQLNVAFSAGQSLTFFNAYNIHGVYTVKALVQAPDGSALSSAYSASVSV